MSSLRVLQVLPQLNRGGVERATLDLVAALRKNSPITYVACENGSLINELIQLGGTHLSLPTASKNPIQMMRNAWSLAKLIRTHNIQIIHARSRAPAWSALWAARWERIPFVTTYHGAYPASHAFKTFYNSVMGRGDRVIAISKFIEQRIKEQHPFAVPNIRLIHEGIDTQTFDLTQIPSSDIKNLRKMWDIPLDTSIFLLPGRITPLKGHIIFLEALHQLKNHKVWGVILGQDPGNTPYLLKLKDLASGLPVRFVHHIASLPIAYAAADFIVSPSLAPEAFGRVIAEAGAMERIIIATTQGAAPEVCHTGKTGYLIPAYNALALANAMNNALKLTQQERQTMEKAARQYICTHFCVKKMCYETIKLYKELLT